MVRNRHPTAIYYLPVCKECIAFVKSYCRHQFQLVCKPCGPNTANVCCLYTEKSPPPPRSCLQGNASAILGCPNLEILTFDGQVIRLYVNGYALIMCTCTVEFLQWKQARFSRYKLVRTEFKVGNIKRIFPADRRLDNNVIVTSKRRRDVVLTSWWRYYCVLCPLGLVSTISQQWPGAGS